MDRAFKTRTFQRWMRKTALTDAALHKAIEEMSAGMIDADLGGGVVKKRIGLDSRSKSRGARTIVATNRAGRWFFLFGYEKNELGSIGEKELRTLQSTGADLLALNDGELTQAIIGGELLEIEL